ncbi:hypothetical protein QBC37DRAFT_400698 [Rhypophila decipiens]|uniref:Uncharacterized protein n=1 Tax=Rhypophila decipiens TaxID=261697 RepID=A0AAN6Y7F3_9PEZI|nr:hypothetical protein QBC37DRAFT_400698 [Rhypophila decipiens]
MDFLNKVTSQITSDNKQELKPATAPAPASASAPAQQQSGGLLGKLGEVANTIGGGGPQSEHKEDFLDKTIDLVQEKVLKQGAQDNESAIEQAKDEKIAGFVREQYKKQFGNDFPGSIKK